MNKERILAARKRLKEFQRNKKDQINKNSKEHTDPEKENNEEKLSIENSPPESEFQEVELNENNENEELKLININKFFDPSSNVDFMENFITPTEKISPQNICINQETNDLLIPSYNNGITDNSIDESNCTISPQMTHETIDQNNDLQDFSIKKCDYPSLDSNVSNSSSTSLQKEHLLQMANAVANVLADETNLEETTLSRYDLEQKNQFLNFCLEEQKKVANQLHIQVSQCTSRISELEAIINNKDAEFESKFIREINPLKEQIQLDAKTIGILVAEKAELTATNFQCQTTIKQKIEDLNELFGKFKFSQQKETELKKELQTITNNMEDFTKSYQDLQANHQELSEKFNKLKKENENFELDTSELRQKLNYKNTELTNLQQELQEKCALLQLSELRIQQLSNHPQEISLLENQHHATKLLEQQLSQMKETLQNVTGEKDEVSKKYQNYVQQLDERYTKLMAEFEVSKKVLVDSEIREQSYIQRLSEMEQQLQREKARVIKPNEDQNQTEKIETLTKSVDNLVLEQENLQSLINEKDNEIETLKKDLKELQDVKEQSIEASKLAAALQSEQLGASRAILQNQQLKVQLDEMNDAFIALSNSKLDLTERVQAERTISKKLNAQLNELELQVEDLKKELTKKESTLVEMEKEKLHAAQIEDQIQHYQAQSHSANTLQQELQNALITIETLKKENQLLHSKLDKTKDNITVDMENLQENIQENIQENSKVEIDGTTEVDISNLKEKTTEVDTLNLEEKCQDNNINDDTLKEKSSVLSKDDTIAITPESVKQLEKRFKETMEKIAELTDEKQRLEHLVLQLQGETETIGEYVTLYQRQRAILHEKAKEKEETFCQLVEQRNQQQGQLHKLKILVAELLKSKNSNQSESCVTEENTPLCNNYANIEGNNLDVMDGCLNKLDDSNQQTDTTTSQILDLLSEIKDCNNGCILEPNFHPCPWCSGKLITI